MFSIYTFAPPEDGEGRLNFRRATVSPLAADLRLVQVHTSPARAKVISCCGWVRAARLEWFGTDRLQCEVIATDPSLG